MEPFRIPLSLEKLTDPYSDAMALLEAARVGGEQAQIGVARLWLAEGIPFAFREVPILYESIRTWISTRLDIHAKEISLTGSGRLGTSIAPTKVGKSFGHQSDLDWFTVSEDLFERLREEFIQWSFDYECGSVKPSNQREAVFWKDNNQRGSSLLSRGFIDSKLIPNLESYPTTRKISQTMFLLVEKLKLTPNAPRPSLASIRCYKSWNSYVQQVCRSLK